MIKYGDIKTATLTIATSTTIGDACDLGIPCEYLNIVIPALDAACTIGLQVSIDGVTYQTLGIGSNVTASTSGTVTTTLEVGGFQFIKIVCGTAQIANRSFTVRGYRG